MPKQSEDINLENLELIHRLRVENEQLHKAVAKLRLDAERSANKHTADVESLKAEVNAKALQVRSFEIQPGTTMHALGIERTPGGFYRVVELYLSGDEVIEAKATTDHPLSWEHMAVELRLNFFSKLLLGREFREMKSAAFGDAPGVVPPTRATPA